MATVFYEFVTTPWFWLFFAVALSLTEIASAMSLTTIWFALSALVTVFIAWFTQALSLPVRFKIQIIVFLALAIVLLVFTRPLAIKKFKMGKIKTNVDALIGRDAVVTKKIVKHDKGEIKIRGQIWTALTEDGSELDKGSECVILSIEGVKVIVKGK